MANNGNGELKRLVWWIMGIFAVLIAAGVVGMGSAVIDNAKSVKQNDARIDAIEGHLGSIEARQERMETKIDRVLERVR